jgi:hypothetical protein
MNHATLNEIKKCYKEKMDNCQTPAQIVEVLGQRTEALNKALNEMNIDQNSREKARNLKKMQVK